MAEPLTITHPLVPSWSPTPIPNLSLSAGGLLALADLNTIAQRTLIAGGSSWLDALVLAPGLHYQQAAAALDGFGTGTGAAQARLAVRNSATLSNLRRLWHEPGRAGTLTLDVSVPARRRGSFGGGEWDRLARRASGLVHRQQRPGVSNPDPDPSPDQSPAAEVDWLSHVLYLASPLLTTAAVVLMVLLADWWGLAFIAALIVSRLLNIWSIKQRSRSDRHQAPPGDDRRTEYAIDLGNGRRAVLRGLDSDLQAVTAHAWLRPKSALDGYLEAASKLLVYLVAAFSGNGSQAGAIVLMALLLVSAGLLGLSNTHARGLCMNGRVARLRIPEALRDRGAGKRLRSEGDGEYGTLDRRPVYPQY